MLKPIPPSQRERNRYLAFEAISDSPPKRKDVIKAIQKSSLSFLGELGTSKAGLWLMDWDSSEKKGILKVTHKAVDEARASMALVKDINGKPCTLKVLGVSGTVKAAKKKFL